LKSIITVFYYLTVKVSYVKCLLYTVFKVSAFCSATRCSADVDSDKQQCQ